MIRRDPYLQYPLRRRGYDHDRYAWEILSDRPPVRWPGDARVALLVVVPLQWFWFDGRAAFAPLGAPSKEYPDYREWSWKDYGMRVGVFRVLDALERFGVTATVAADAESCRRYPRVLDEVRGRGLELVAHGLSAGDLHHDGLTEGEERRLVSEAIGVVSELAGAPVRGWLSPSRAESGRTIDLLAEHGLDYVLDWANDDLPYALRARTGELTSVPLSYELLDVNAIWQLRHTAPEWSEQVADAAALIHAEASSASGRLLALTVTPWLLGQPHRIPYLEHALAKATEPDGVWPASGASIVDACRATGSSR